LSLHGRRHNEPSAAQQLPPALQDPVTSAKRQAALLGQSVRHLAFAASQTVPPAHCVAVTAEPAPLHTPSVRALQVTLPGSQDRHTLVFWQPKAQARLLIPSPVARQVVSRSPAQLTAFGWHVLHCPPLTLQPNWQVWALARAARHRL
jgi:hypothetical protein